jgi:hypothetical protein
MKESVDLHSDYKELNDLANNGSLGDAKERLDCDYDFPIEEREEYADP